MRLKEIKLAGFKSFVDPTTASFPGNRCAVVGPNGCRKSNIIDAVRWVLGESSARQLRAQALTDVIFNGAGTRPPASLASIELVFDNRDGRVGGEFAKGKFASYAEIAIRRQVNRDGQSLYYLNGTRCRRRDVADVFLGTGFGPRSYSIIEQGMVSQLVQAKPEELRAYLEEAAGISKYRERRRETQNRIKHTVENLERLADISDELDGQLKTLKRQAKAAERFRELKEEERRRTAELHALRLIDLGSQLDRQEARANALDVEHEAALAERQHIDTALEQQRAAHAELGEEQAGVQGRYHQVGAEVARLEESIGFSRQRLGQIHLDLEALSVRQQETGEELDRDTARIARMQAEIAASTPDLAKFEAEDDAAAARLEQAESRVRDSQRAWEEYANRAAENASGIRVRQSRMEHGERALQRLRARSGTLDPDLGDVTDADVASLARRIEECQRRLDALDAEIGANAQALAAAREQAEGGERALDTARRDAQGVRSDLAALSAVQEAALGRTGPARGVARWLEDNGLDKVPRLGEQLAVEPGWEMAVETVLGNAVEAIEVADTGSLAEELGAEEFGQTGGRLTLFETRSPPETKFPTETELPTVPRALAEFVRPDLGALLAGVFAAESTSEALLNRSRLMPGHSIVTRDGVWVGRDWIRIDKGADEAASVIRRARELESLRETVAQADARLVQESEQVADARRRGAALEDEREALRERHAVATIDLSRIKTEHDVHQVRLEEAAARARRSAAEKQEIDVQIESESRQLEDCALGLAALSTDAEALRVEGDALRAARDRDAGELESVRRTARDARDGLHRLRVENQGLKASLAAGETARARLLKQSEDFEKRAAEVRVALAEIEGAMPRQNAVLEAKLADRLDLERQLADFRRRMEAIEAEMGLGTAQRNEAQQTVDEARSRLEGARVERERLAANRDNLLTKLAETDIDFHKARDGLPSDATEEQWVEALDRLEARIGRLGPINLVAIDDYETQSERKRYLDHQREDLETALAALGKAIRRIDRDTRARFKDTFERVNVHLKDLFPRFFGGGEAYLVHTGEDWLDTGVTLMARPPGRRNVSIHPLSGGEKAMTAVALIFSIFQLNPSPVCLLDEVDAPLDDVNAERLSELIREMSNDVQFVVITHNKRTIEMADHLLGVTMQEAGVSRLVSVDMERTERLAAV